MARSPSHPLSLLFRPSLGRHDYKNNYPSSTGPGFCLKQPPPRLVSTKGVEDDSPHHREGSKPCLNDIRASLLLAIVPHHEDTSLTVHGLNIIAWDNDTHKGERDESPLSVFASTNPDARLTLDQPPPPPPKEGGGATHHKAGGSRTHARTRVFDHHVAFSSKSFARQKFFSPVHFS